MTEIWIFAAILWGLVWGAFTAVVADSKGRPGGWWFLGGFLFSLPAMLAAIGIMPAEREPEPELARRRAARRPKPDSSFELVFALGGAIALVLGIALFLWLKS